MRDLLDGADDIEGAVQTATKRDPAFLDVGAGDVEFERVHALGVRKDSGQLDVLIERAAADVDDVRDAEPSEFWQLLGDVAVHANTLQADGVQHARRCLDDPLRRVSFAWLEEQTLGRNRTER